MTTNHTPDRPSAAAIGQAVLAYWNADGFAVYPSDGSALLKDVMARARELDAARPAEVGDDLVEQAGEILFRDWNRNDRNPGGSFECLRKLIREVLALAAAKGGEDWVPVNVRLPEYGQRIEGRNAVGQTWEEEYDPQEPLGLMREWRPLVPAREKKHAAAPAAPAGEWVMVPRVLTDAMHYALGGAVLADKPAAEWWTDMLAAAPAAPAVGERPSLTDCAKTLDAAVDVLCSLTGERRAQVTDDVRFDHLYDTARQILSLGANMRATTPRGPGGREADPILRGLPEAIARLDPNEGRWQPCSGCYETEDGHPVGDYPHSPILGCVLGGGCHECGGLGAVWDTLNYNDFAEEALQAASGGGVGS